ncbi:MAG TPA: peptidoglycan DD-metalloendopeptidase family protein [Candidatus Saccharicenans sp.]|jgi:septal ring factor EnvC (AmiA/AmiB activator)|nr:peptidoglycan DD-metalloendopeptidase family protein [Candidatus Saccharicenans sp.]HRD02487.1 peptidoglycan DD-metalloendopeptidase family protein [Candidatus Saccharicenans sp.]
MPLSTSNEKQICQLWSLRPAVKITRLLAACQLVLLILTCLPLYPQQESSAASDIEKRLTLINQQISQLKTRLDEEAKKEKSLLSTLETIRLKRKLLQNEIDALNLRQKMTARELTDLARKIEATEASLQKEKEAVEKTLATLYKFGRLDFMHFFLKANNLEVFLRESKNLTFLAQYQGEAISAYLNTIKELEELRKEVKVKQTEIDGLLKDAASKQQDILQQEAASQQLLAQIKKDKKAHEQMMAELKGSSDDLQRLLKRLQNQEIALPSPFIPLNERKGKLPWPVSGKVISKFGPEKNPRFKTTVINNGLEIAPAGKDKTIKAIHGGRIVYADYFQGYGNLLIIDHGLSYYTLYGHCSSFLVKPGDVVQPGQAIALVGDSDSLKGECLYFELRYKTRALDPLPWLRRR